MHKSPNWFYVGSSTYSLKVKSNWKCYIALKKQIYLILSKILTIANMHTNNIQSLDFGVLNREQWPCLQLVQQWKVVASWRIIVLSNFKKMLHEWN